MSGPIWPEPTTPTLLSVRPRNVNAMETSLPFGDGGAESAARAGSGALHFEAERGRGVAGGAPHEEPAPAAAQHQLLGQLEDEPQPGRRLGMPVDEARAVAVEALR